MQLQTDNVLRFSVEYQRTIFAKNIAVKGIDPEQLDDSEYCKRHNIDMTPLYHDEERITRVAKHIMEHHEQHVHPQGKDTYTALFAVDSIPILGKYYDAFQKLNKTVPEEETARKLQLFFPIRQMKIWMMEQMNIRRNCWSAV